VTGAHWTPLQREREGCGEDRAKGEGRRAKGEASDLSAFRLPPFALRLGRHAMMRLPRFRYWMPKTAAEAVRIKEECGPEGAYVAGGTDLYPNMKRRQQTPRDVIGRDVQSEQRLPGFDAIRLPGERRRQCRAERERDGIPLPEALAAQLDKLAGEIGVKKIEARG